MIFISFFILYFLISNKGKSNSNNKKMENKKKKFKSKRMMFNKISMTSKSKLVILK